MTCAKLACDSLLINNEDFNPTEYMTIVASLQQTVKEHSEWIAAFDTGSMTFATLTVTESITVLNATTKIGTITVGEAEQKKGEVVVHKTIKANNILYIDEQGEAHDKLSEVDKRVTDIEEGGKKAQDSDSHRVFLR